MTKSFRLFWLGEAVSLLGTATTATLLPLLAVTELGAGPAWTGALAAATWLPWLLLGLIAGAVVDRLPPRGVMITSDLVAAVAAFSVPLAAWVGTLRLGHLVAVGFAIGCCTVFFRAAMPRLILGVTEADERGRATSRLYATESGSTIVGPGLAGGIATVVTAVTGVLLDAISFLVSALCLWRTRPTEVETARDAAEPLRTRIGSGLNVIRRDPILRFTVPVAAVQNFALTGLISLQVVFLVDDLDASSAVAGAVLAATGIGGVAGALLSPHVARRIGTARAMVALQLISCSFLLVPLATPGIGTAWMVVGLAVGEAALLGDNVVRSTWRLSYVPAHLQGRVSTTTQVLVFSTMPLAGIVAGWLGHQVGVRPALAAMLALHVAGALTFPFGPVGRRRDLPERFADAHPDLVMEPA